MNPLKANDKISHNLFSPLPFCLKPQLPSRSVCFFFFSPPPLSFSSYPAVNRYSSSSLSSQASNEVSNITGQSESSDEVFNMQVISLALHTTALEVLDWIHSPPSLVSHLLPADFPRPIFINTLLGPPPAHDSAPVTFSPDSHPTPHTQTHTPLLVWGFCQAKENLCWSDQIRTQCFLCEFVWRARRSVALSVTWFGQFRELTTTAGEPRCDFWQRREQQEAEKRTTARDKITLFQYCTSGLCSIYEVPYPGRVFLK